MWCLKTEKRDTLENYCGRLIKGDGESDKNSQRNTKERKKGRGLS